MNPTDIVIPTPDDECDWVGGAESENTDIDGDDVVSDDEGGAK